MACPGPVTRNTYYLTVPLFVKHRRWASRHRKNPPEVLQFRLERRDLRLVGGSLRKACVP